MNNGKGYIRPVIDAARCDGCGDCAALAPGIFRQAGKEPAVIGDPEGGPFKLLAKAASRCPTGAIKPGMPAGALDKESKKIIAMAERYNHG